MVQNTARSCDSSYRQRAGKSPQLAAVTWRRIRLSRHLENIDGSFDRRWKGVSGFLFGRCSCTDAYFLAILNTWCRGSVVNMYDAISDHLPMLLALEDAIYVLQPSLEGGFRIFDWTVLF